MNNMGLTLSLQFYAIAIKSIVREITNEGLRFFIIDEY